MTLKHAMLNLSIGSIAQLQEIIEDVWPIEGECSKLLKRVITTSMGDDSWTMRDAACAAILLKSDICITVYQVVTETPCLTSILLPKVKTVASFLHSKPSEDQLNLVIPAVCMDSYGKVLRAQATLDLITGAISLEGDKTLFRSIQKELGAWYFGRANPAIRKNY